MTVPDYQTLMRPTLVAVADGQDHALSEIRDRLASEFHLTDEDMAERIRTGMPVWNSRVHWALAYLYQAGLVTRPRRATYRISDDGRRILAEHPDRVDNSVLEQFPSYRAFKDRSRSRGGQPSPGTSSLPEPDDDLSPMDRIRSAVAEFDETLATELLDRIRAEPPAFLERLVLRLLTAMGYGDEQANETLGGSGDGGVDGIIREDPLGLGRVYLQAKRYGADRKVNRPDVQGFVGAILGHGADRGVFIATCEFSDGAIEYAANSERTRVILIDGSRLAHLMIQYGVGVQVTDTFRISELDEDFFDPDR